MDKNEKKRRKECKIKRLHQKRREKLINAIELQMETIGENWTPEIRSFTKRTALRMLSK